MKVAPRAFGQNSKPRVLMPTILGANLAPTEPNANELLRQPGFLLGWFQLDRNYQF
jgi:hypothetical protein